MKKTLSYLLIGIGIVLLMGSGIEYFSAKSGVSQATTAAVKMTDDKQAVDAVTFTPELNEPLGLLTIPKLDVSLPIIEGVDEEMLSRGVGHLPSTALPSGGEQILLSGHRDTVFRDFGDIEIGDEFIVELPYGTFHYEMRESEIVDKDDTTVIRSMGEEVLTLSTCYPFQLLGAAPERYVIYAYPVH